MTWEDPMEVCEVSESGTWSDSDCNSDGSISSATLQYTTSSIEALDEAKQVLEDAMEVIRALQEHLEGEEQAIAQSIATIHHQRNFLTPVMRLPPEILSRIFVFHAQIESSWLNAALTSTRVCKRWQEIGWACPELWSHINYRDCRSAAWMAGMIKRSCTLPLSLTIGNRATVGAQKMAWLSITCTASNRLTCTSARGGYWAFFEAFSQPVPLLEHLTVSSYARTVFAFPPEFLGGSAPSLRHMKLSTNSYIRWDSGLFAHLVTLEVSGSENFGGVTPPSFGMLLSALVRMPDLETLILRHCFSPTLSATVGAHVDLSNLKRLEVATSLTCCTCLLRQITINAGAIVLLDLEHCSSASKDDFDKFFAVFPSHLYTTSTPVAQALKFTWRDSYDLNIDMWTVQQNTEFKTSQNASIKLVFNWGLVRLRGVVGPLDLMWTCLAALASPQLHSFRTSGNHLVGWDAEVWRQLAHVAPSLQRLAAGTEHQSAELCKALSPPDVPDPALADCCFPALSYLEFKPPRDHPTPNPDGEESLFPVTLARSLAARALIGCSTPELAFIMSHRDYSKDWFYPFGDAIPNIIVHTREWWREAVMVRIVIFVRSPSY
ncbi:hypothetical protein BD779DRAFT_1675702 [Infundibulicybe gibba]|nr:hypothetical protein BD779DRAFT_1675702 [Infundibulicybe gibba]